MLHASGLPQFLWREAAMHAIWLKNCTVMKALDGVTPLEALFREKLDLSKLAVWGCQAWVHDSTRSKLDGCAKEGCWVGFDMQSKGHQI
ncbi:hypothetical protein JAAARDRAFT_142187 [Jaapia argillacea MUCL 33604]|uniref:Retroviral polymerase SH3-like domain-containing protein n=1 Tax=Jaapia argillacea MUCL 33604 TaxID=933084 RepID=A0A067P8Z0_9AGAM|nr:hypothetical protein JAAARDRAFT_142187 [Jaapia argillacea MUCL 33604]